MFVFNFGIGLLKRSVKLGQLIIFYFLGYFPSLNHFFQTNDQKAVLFTVFFSSAVAKENQLKTLAIVLLANF